MAKEKILMLCPVGTSLRNSNLKDLIDKSDDEREKRLSEWLKEMGGPGVKYPTAEVQSIVNWLESSDKVGHDYAIELCLFPSKSKDGEGESQATAAVTRIMLKLMEKGEFPGNVSFAIHSTPLDIVVDNKEQFNRSVDILFEQYDALRENADDARVVINATGGYKAICAYSSLYAQLHNLTCIYTFEGKPTAIELLPLPIGYALDTLDDEVGILRALERLSGGSSEIQAENLPPWLQSLIGSKLEPLGLAKSLLNHYVKNRHTAEAIGSGMLNQTDEKFRRYLEENIRGPWSQLWLGDQIPETVEHSRRHSKRLMELAGNLYRNAPEELDFLGLKKPHIVALLIAAIYLHDIGHTVMAHPVSEKKRERLRGVFPLGSFPSCVREMHHLLSAELIRERAYDIEGALFPQSQDDGIDREMFASLVPLISEHHRGYTTLTLAQGVAGKCKDVVRNVGLLLYGEEFYDTLKPLEARLTGLEDKMAAWGVTAREIATVAALLRVLDGCDVQVDRTVSEEYMRARLKRTKEEGRALYWELLPLLRGRWEKFAGQVQEVHGMSQSLRPESGITDTTWLTEAGDHLKKNCGHIYSGVIEALLERRRRSGDYLPGTEEPVDFMTLSLLNRYAFKWEQFLHFYKHYCVGFVLPVRKAHGENASVVFEICANGSISNENGAVTANLKGVVEDINEEIKGTGDLLASLNLTARWVG